MAQNNGRNCHKNVISLLQGLTSLFLKIWCFKLEQQMNYSSDNDTSVVPMSLTGSTTPGCSHRDQLILLPTIFPPFSGHPNISSHNDLLQRLIKQKFPIRITLWVTRIQSVNVCVCVIVCTTYIPPNPRNRQLLSSPIVIHHIY